uniref:Fas binding factor 1 n=1 Tax=Gopherus evgoodei TaxID=1825980 RepID=A0A8C5EZE5_9SAUR
GNQVWDEGPLATLWINPSREMDDMEADLLGIKKSSSGAGRTMAKGSKKLDSSGDLAKTSGKLTTVEKGECDKLPLCQRFLYTWPDDPLAGLLSDDEENAVKKLPPTGTKSSPERHTGPAKGISLSSAPGHAVAPVRRREELTFEDDGDDLMDALGFGESPRGELKQERKGEEEEPRPARSKLEELLGNGTAAKLQERPITGEHKEFKLDTKYQQQPDKETIWDDEDFTFGAYQPTLASTPEGRQSRRQSVRFSADNVNELKMDQRSKPTTPATTSPMRGSKTGADWLGLKDEDFIDLDPPSPAKDPSPASQLLPGTKSAAGEAAVKPRPLEEEKDSWLNDTLSRKKSQLQGKVKEKRAGPSSSLRQDDELLYASHRYPVPWLTTQKQASSLTSESGKGARPGDTSNPILVTFHIQVRKLELERNQQKLLLESLQQRHQEDLELIENAHRSRVKVMEESSRQREVRLRQENEELAAQYLSHCQSAERAKLELLAQQQRRLAELEQEKVQEVERLRELQRASILEMRKDHEEQLQRLKRLKDQEIDAVTSATSHTRSLNGVIEQMEKFSSNLSDLSYKVEATHHNTSQELEIGARQRDEQLRVLQDRLTRQQRDMEEERSRLQEVIAKMEARLSEQTRLLEQERWRVTAEQSKVESLQRSLEEQRRVMTQQLTMEREELERAKNVLLEEQKSVMQKCAEERRKLAMEWSEFHTQQKLSKERTERDVDRALQIDSQREGAIMTLAKEQADLKIRASELRAKEEQLARERESVEQERQELRLEKERLNAAALHVKQRAEEIDSMSKLSSQKYEEGERALLEAKKVESEHRTRLCTVQQRLERLRQQEQHLHQERQNLAHQRRQLEQLREELPNSPVQFLTKPRVPHPDVQTKSLSTTHCKLLLHARAVPAELYARLVLLKHTAEQDRDFLEDEQFFLETLKKASYNMSSQTA